MSDEPAGAYLETVINSQPAKFKIEAGQVCYIGRDADNGVVLADYQVSRRHAMVQGMDSGECYVIDLGSRNGTFVNQRRVTTPVTLRSGDVIRIGGHRLVFHGIAEAVQARHRTWSETVVDVSQWLITTLVADIRDFTGLSARLGESGTSAVIGAFVQGCSAVLTEQGAWAQKFIGDAVMAIWLHNSDPPERAELFRVFASLARMFETVAGLQARFRLDAPIRIGAGINTGLASVGNLGTAAASDYTALSDAVTLAFRLETATKEIGCDIAIGPKTYETLTGMADVAGLFESRVATLKGYAEAKQAYAAKQAALGPLVEALGPHR